MSTAVISLFEMRSRSSDWSNQELAEFHRVAGILRRAGLDIELDRGLTDEGDAWLVFCHCETGEVIAHFARYDGQYVVAAPMIDRTLKGRRFNDLVESFLDSCPVVLAGSRPRREQRRVFLHPVAALTALIATLFFLSDLSKAQAAEDRAGAPEGDAAKLPPHGDELVRDVFYRDQRDERGSDRREEIRGAAEGHRADIVLTAIAIAVAIATDESHDREGARETAASMLVADLSSAMHDAIGDGLLTRDDRLERQLAGAEAMYRPAELMTGAVTAAGPDRLDGEAQVINFAAPAEPLDAVIIARAAGIGRLAGGTDSDPLADAEGWLAQAADAAVASGRGGPSGSRQSPPAEEPAAQPAKSPTVQAISGDADLQSFIATFLGGASDLGIVLTTDADTARRLEELTGGGTETPAAGPDTADEIAKDPAQAGEDTPASGDTTGQPTEPPTLEIDFTLLDAYEVMLTFARMADDGVGVYQSGMELYMYELPALEASATGVATEHLGTDSGLTIHLIGFTATFSEVWQELT